LPESPFARVHKLLHSWQKRNASIAYMQ